MPLSIGDKLGHYEVLSLLGQGGMGEVYRARDTMLKREVALKVLPAIFLRDPDRLVRFQREAEVLASLDHPHIGHIHGIVDSTDAHGLVLALIEGPTLGERIEAGPIPLDEAILIAKQIVEALEYAHDRGVVHRDLKPPNIKITPDGVVKVLDFGLAKVLEDEPPPSSLANSPTLTLGHTRTGVILGTAAYMSPEQAVGRAVDRRSDIFSFGAVLYEMLAGKRAFAGATTPDVLEAVVKNDPDWSVLPVATPVYVRRLLERTLAKDRKQRLQAIGEARIALENTGAAYTDAGVTTPSQSRLGWLWPAVAVAATVALATLAFVHFREQPVDRPLVRLEVDLGADVSLPTAFGGGSGVIISPDGARLVYASGDPVKLFTRRLDQPQTTELPGTEGASSPFFSPDGDWVGFLARGQLNKISVEGGAVVPLGDDLTAFGGASWGEDGSIVVSHAFDKGLLRIPAGGGPPATLAELVSGELAFAIPQILPGGKAVLFSTGSAREADRTIEVLTLADRHRKKVARGGTSPRYLATGNGAGHLIYSNGATLFGVPFDLEKLETRGTAVPILDEIDYQAQTGTGQFDISRTGTLVYRKASGSASGAMTVQWMDPTGGKAPFLAKPGVYSNPSLSPDGKRLVMLGSQTGKEDVWVYDQQRDALPHLTSGGRGYTHPIWSIDGQNVAFGALGTGIVWARADGAGQPRTLTLSRNIQFPWSFSPDGKRLAYVELAGTPHIWTVSLEEHGGQLNAGAPEAFLKSQFSEESPMFSPDGRWLAYESNEQGRIEVYVRPFPPPSSGQERKWQISNTGGNSPRWSRSGHDLLYQFGDQIMTVRYTGKGDEFGPEKPRMWIVKVGGTQWDLAPDGKRVAVLTAGETADVHKLEHEVVFVENFFDELRRKAPARK